MSIKVESSQWHGKGATKLYFTHYSCAVMILFNNGLCKSVFSTFSLENLFFLSFWVFCVLYLFLTLFMMGFFGAAHGWRGAKRPPLPKICHTYSTMMKLGTIIPYPKKIQKIYESRDTPLFAISRNTGIDCILIHNFYLF